MTRPRPVMACAECGPVITEYVTACPLCGSLRVEWCDLAAGLERLARIFTQPTPYKLCLDAANLIRAQQDTIEALQQAQGGAKRRRQELEARRLFEVLEDWGNRSTVGLSEGAWKRAIDEVNDRYRSYHKPPSDETKALVAEMFAERQETRADV